MMPTTRPTSYFAEDNIRYVFIDGNCCHHMADCYASLRQQLSLPDYFGDNLDALEEVLNDLEWIPEEQIKVIFLNLKSLLENEEKRAAFLDVFVSSEQEKMEVIFLD